MNLIVFDIDDTLTKSEFQHQLAFVNAMREIGVIDINQNWKEYTHHTDSYILSVNYEKTLETILTLQYQKTLKKEWWK